MNFGKLLKYEQEGNKILFHFEKKDGRVEVLTEKILNVFAGYVSEDHRSKAIEGEKAKETVFTVEQQGEAVVIATSCVTAKVYDEFKVDFYTADGKVICRDYRGERKAFSRISEEMVKLMEAEGHKYSEEESDAYQVLKELEGDESFYGLGDKTGFLDKYGYEYVMWNTDDPKPHVDNFKSLYKSIPFFMTLKKETVYGLFFDNPYRSSFDMGKENTEYFRYAAKDGNLDYYLISGENMAEVLGGYTYLTGTVPVPQKWVLGYQQSRWSYMSETEVRTLAKTLRGNAIPCDVIHLDIDYMEGYRVFTWNKDRYDDPKKFIADLAEDGMKIVCIIDPGVKLDEGYSVYDEGVANDYFAKTPEGEIYVNAVWPGDAVYPDFGNPKVRDWWASNQQFLLDRGVRGVWNDMNEPASFRGELPQDVVFTDEDEKADHARMHNLYGHNMAKATYKGLKERDGRRPYIITRACYSGTQKYGTVWTGDNHSIWAHVQMEIPQLCNLGLSGFAFAGTDVGGFGSDTTKELLIRWVQVGSFSPLFRNHSAAGTRYQEPWQFDKETLDIYRKAVEFRYHIIPYYYDLFFHGEKNGLPVMRPLVLHYEKDPAVHNLNSEFLVGENMLVAPVVNPGETQKMVYLPEGTWYDYLTGEKLKGNQWLIKAAPLDTCPVYVKAGTILPVWPAQAYVGEKDTDEVLELEVFKGEGVYEHIQDDGETFAYRDGVYNQYHVTVDAAGCVKITLEHDGYQKHYAKVRVVCEGQIKEAQITNGEAVLLF